MERYVQCLKVSQDFTCAVTWQNKLEVDNEMLLTVSYVNLHQTRVNRILNQRLVNPRDYIARNLLDVCNINNSCDKCLVITDIYIGLIGLIKSKKKKKKKI